MVRADVGEIAAGEEVVDASGLLTGAETFGAGLGEVESSQGEFDGDPDDLVS